jgi:aminoglycoside 3-N-acetyltransferase
MKETVIKIPSDISFEDLPFNLNINENDTVFISADLKNIAYALKSKNKIVQIDQFIDNFKLILKNGTIVIPAYTDNLKNLGTFNYLKDKPTTGSISNKVFKRKDFTRSKDPLHSVFAWGKYTDQILDLNDKSTFGKNSIYSLLHQQNAKFIFIDVHIENSFTFVHYVEEHLAVNYRTFEKITYFNIDNQNDKSTKEILFFKKKWGIINDFKRLNFNFHSKGIYSNYSYSDIPIQVCSAQSAFDEIKRTIISKEKVHRFNFRTFIKDALKFIINHNK